MLRSRDSLPTAALEKIDSLCDAFECDLRAGGRPRIEDILAQAGMDERTELLQSLLRRELEMLCAEGVTPDCQSYIARFPADATVVAAAFAGMATQGQASTITHAPRPGDETWPPARDERGPPLPRIPGYEILGKIGGGGMGIVYKARHLRLNRVVALKTILHGGEARQDMVERFRREAEAVARLQHPGIVQIFDFGSADGLPYFSMEYVEGMDLRHALQEKPLPDRAAARLVAGLARTMHVVHERQIIHRDLKPGNILLRIAGGDDRAATINLQSEICNLDAKISDFGLAKPLDASDAQTGTNAIVGTPCYMAPEQARPGNRAIGPGADIYALGAILYECVVGRPPFKAESAMETIYQVLEQEPIPPRQFQPRLAADLETICLKCLSKDPARRYATALDLAHDLDRFVNGEPIQARPAGGIERSWKWIKRHPRLVGGAAAVFLSLVAGIVGIGFGLVEAKRESKRAGLEEQKAKAESERAAREETKARALLAQSYAQSAQLAAQRGHWRNALDQIDKALEAGHADAVALLVQRVKALVAVNDPRVFKEVEALASRPDLGRHEGAVLMLQGDVAMIAEHDKAVTLLNEALKRDLTAADRAYALGLLADSAPGAVAHWEETLRLEPFHYRAGGLITFTLLVLGRIDDADHRLTLAEHVFPDDPSYRLLRAVVYALRDDLPAALKTLDLAREQLGEQEYLMAQNAVELLNLVRHMSDITASDFGPLDKHLVRMQAMAQRIVDYSARVREREAPSARRLTLYPAGAKTFVELPQAAARAAATRNLNPIVDFLQRTVKVHPEGTLYYVMGLALFAEDRMYQAADAFLAAATAPSMSPVKRNALFHAILVEGYLGRPNQPKPDVQMRARAAGHLKEFLRLGPIQVREAELLCKIARFSGELAIARQVADQWRERDPKSIALWRQVALNELKGEAYAPAIEAARKVLEARPMDADALKVVRDAQKKLKEGK